MIDSWAKFKEVWVHITQFFGDVWDLAVNGIVNAWRDAQNYIANTVLEIVAEIDPTLDLESAKDSLNNDMHGLDKKNRSEETNKNILDRETESKTELKKIKDERVGSNEVIDDDAKLRQEDREKIVDAAAAKRKTKVDEAKEELRKLTDKANSLPDPEETAMVKNAKANSAPGSEFNTTAQKAMGVPSGGDLSTKSGLQSLITLINRDGQNKTLEEIGKDHSGLLAGVLFQLEKNHFETVEA